MASIQAVAQRVLAGAAVLAIAGSTPAWPGPAQASPPPAGRQAGTASMPGLMVTVDRDGGPLVAGREVTYTITIQHRGDQPAPVTVRASLPPWLGRVTVDGDGEVTDGSVRWPLTVPPDRPARLQLTGSYARPDRDEQAGGPIRVALTACVVAPADGRPQVCATDIAQLNAPMPALVRWLAVMAVLVATGGAAFHQWRRSRPTTGPDPATVTT